LQFVKKSFEGVVPQVNNKSLTQSDKEFIDKVEELVQTYIQQLDDVKIRDGLKTTMTISKLGNIFLQAAAPWDLIKTDIPRCSTVIGIIVSLIRLLAILLHPYIPTVTDIICDQLNISLSENCLSDEIKVKFDLKAFKEGHVINNPVVIFPTIEEKEIARLKEMFGGADTEEKEVKDGPFPLVLVAGTISSAIVLPKKPSILVLQVNVGEKVDRQVVANIADDYKPDQLVNKPVVVLLNIRQKQLSGFKSEALVLTLDDGKQKVLLTLPKSIPPGTKVGPEGLLRKSSLYDMKIGLAPLKIRTDAKKRILFVDAPLKAGDVDVVPDRNVPADVIVK